MRCPQMKRKLSAFLDGEVPEDEKQLISSHLESCDHCRQELADLSQVSDVLNLIEEIQVSPYFMVRLRQKLAVQQAKSLSRLSFMAWVKRALFPTVATVLVFVSFLLGSHAGKAIYHQAKGDITTANTEITNMLGVTALDELPEGSLGWAYNNLLIGVKE